MVSVLETQMQNAIIAMAKELREISAGLKDIADELRRFNDDKPSAWQGGMR